MSAFLAFKYLHIATVILSIFLFVLRFFLEIDRFCYAATALGENYASRG
ncbi:Uncharacterised protein [Ewingella americana]|uniref:Uncharacterized protein n=1 Tax=Ewingella americana TaxID=41202 RepID=A0A377NCG7_9GAMM|nr:Uncharacterised protein [Ewingella americana]